MGGSAVMRGTGRGLRRKIGESEKGGLEIGGGALLLAGFAGIGGVVI